MKIGNNKPPDGPESRKIKKSNEIPKAGPPVSGAGAGAAPSDSIIISKQGKEAAKLIEAAGKLPDVRTDKVNTIREAIGSGTYKVDSAQVAQKIIKEII
ncbi:MAG: flagellar biosynthesis anti-sigma factor FlgM [Nitrospiraceae bacterium]|nr:flagellar biosynthesis anti-sigma factor FlgM [Nitrospiraceae bacterium]